MIASPLAGSCLKPKWSLVGSVVADRTQVIQTAGQAKPLSVERLHQQHLPFVLRVPHIERFSFVSNSYTILGDFFKQFQVVPSALSMPAPMRVGITWGKCKIMTVAEKQAATISARLTLFILPREKDSVHALTVLSSACGDIIALVEIRTDQD